MKGKNRIDGSDLEQKKITLNPGVSFEAGEAIYKKFIQEIWDSVKDKLTEYEYNSDYKSMGCGYAIQGERYFIYPTYTSFVISRVEYRGFKEI